jgi:hypothetical protein
MPRIPRQRTLTRGVSQGCRQEGKALPYGASDDGEPQCPSSSCAAASTADDLVTDCFAAAALTVDLRDLLFRFVISGSPEKPKGPGEGALGQVGVERLSNRRQATGGGFHPLLCTLGPILFPRQLIAVDTRIIQKNGLNASSSSLISH